MYLINKINIEAFFGINYKFKCNDFSPSISFIESHFYIIDKVEFLKLSCGINHIFYNFNKKIKIIFNQTNRKFFYRHDNKRTVCIIQKDIEKFIFENKKKYSVCKLDHQHMKVLIAKNKSNNIIIC